MVLNDKLSSSRTGSGSRTFFILDDGSTFSVAEIEKSLKSLGTKKAGNGR